ncbi:MAG: iron-containing alcohol dehydrogenase [Coriobacteriales bacterium]|jgi:glycerol dehydrogenase|nr:iron-containing alcohol dehydrogenase [Coriobacteriales bacterium]
MAEIKTPRVYYSEPGAIEHLADFVYGLGKKALILGGPTALSLVGQRVFVQLEAAGIQYQTASYAGRPTKQASCSFALLATQWDADFIVGIGGGRAIDTAKFTASEAGLPVIAIPTIAATCAAFAATVVTYDETGVSTGFFVPLQSPVAVFADTEVIAQAPSRYLKSGLADTLAKWYENQSVLKYSDSLFLHQQLVNARLAMDIITKRAPDVLSRLDQLEQSDSEARRVVGWQSDFIELVDAVILLAGLVGCITANTDYSGLAHPFYTACTWLRQTDIRLHGERVAYGLVAQAVALGESEEFIEELLNLLTMLDQPLTLEQIGVSGNRCEDRVLLAEKTVENLGRFEVNGQKPSIAFLKEVFDRTDKLQHWRKNGQEAVA